MYIYIYTHRYIYVYGHEGPDAEEAAEGSRQEDRPERGVQDREVADAADGHPLQREGEGRVEGHVAEEEKGGEKNRDQRGGRRQRAGAPHHVDEDALSLLVHRVLRHQTGEEEHGHAQEQRQDKEDDHAEQRPGKAWGPSTYRQSAKPSVCP